MKVSRPLFFALFSLISLFPAFAQQAGIQGIAEREIAHRQLVAQDYAQKMINEGTQSMTKRDYESAFAQFKAAVDALPNAPAVAPLRKQALDGFSRASVQLTEQRISEGRFQDAEATIVIVLQDKYNPNYPPAVALQSQLRKPDYYNKTETPTFVGKVEEVTQLLTDADGYYQSARYDSAFKKYEEVLQIDRYNIAARRGMEKVNNARMRFSEESYNETRSRQLEKIDKAWELPINQYAIKTSAIIEQPEIKTQGTGSIEHKLDSIIIPRIDFRETTVKEAIDFIKQRAAALDTAESDPSKKGVNIFLKLDPTAIAAESATRITLSLTDIPLREALGYIATSANLKIKVEPYAVAIVPQAENTDVIYTAVFQVPPGFISNLPAAPPAAGSTTGIAEGTTSVASRSNVMEYLKSQGVDFPPEASAYFIATTGRLIVRNTQRSIDTIEELLKINNSTPRQIEIESKFLEVNQNNLKELGVDWLIGQFAMPFGSGVYGSGGTTGAASTLDPNNYPFNIGNTPVGSSTQNGSGSVTSGNRSGTTAITANSIDALLFATPAGPAPGILSLAGIFTNPQFQIVLRGLNQKKGIDLMTAPKVTTKSGLLATIQIIREFRYPTEFDPPQIPQTTGGSFTPITPTTPSAFETRNLGVELEVQPTVGADGFTIDLRLTPKVTEFEGFINYGSPISTTVFPVLGISGNIVILGPSTKLLVSQNTINQPIFSVREVTTDVTIYDGSTVVLGGLMREDVQKVEDKTPILGDIPLLGRAFRSAAEQHTKKNLIIFVSAKLLDPAGQPVVKEIEDDNAVAVPDASEMNKEAVPGDPMSAAPSKH
ncbi:MAG: Amuc_1098 family type IV pilus outer membrane protein [Chthoniobacterales bacterium]